MEFDIRLTRYGSRVATSLTTAALAELSERYGGEGDTTPIQPGEFDPPEGGFLVAYVAHEHERSGAERRGRSSWAQGEAQAAGAERRAHEPAGCVGWRTYEEDESTAELKRLYVVPAYRGRGVAKALLAAVEDAARQAGRRRIWLEAGTAQPEAIGLYEQAGYSRIADFGRYKGYEGVRSYGRDL
jgi:ribosomal protein S18 acetylase RimI-like enzyme